MDCRFAFRPVGWEHALFVAAEWFDFIRIIHRPDADWLHTAAL